MCDRLHLLSLKMAFERFKHGELGMDIRQSVEFLDFPAKVSWLIWLLIISVAFSGISLNF